MYSPWHWAGPTGLTASGSKCVCYTQNSGWRVQCVFFILFFCNYFIIKYLVGNFTLALTDLAEAAEAIVPGSQIKVWRRDAAGCTITGPFIGSPPAEALCGLTPTHCHSCHHWESPCNKGAAGPQLLCLRVVRPVTVRTCSW